MKGMMFWFDAYLCDTHHLKTHEHGAYILILASLWTRGGWIPGDDQTLSRVTRLRLDHWRRIKPIIMPLLLHENGQVSQKRLLKELDAALIRGQKAKASAESKWAAKALETNNPPHANASPEQCLGDATPTPPTLKKEQTAIAVCKKEPSGKKSFPQNYVPNETTVLLCTKLGISNAELQESTERIRGWAEAHGRRMADWNRAHQNWLRRDADHRREKNGKSVIAAADRLVEAFNNPWDEDRRAPDHRIGGSESPFALRLLSNGRSQ